MNLNWSNFDPREYVKDNYANIHSEDRQIIDKLLPFYSSLPNVNHALEIGVGPNIYPLMLTLPKANHITAIDPNPRSLQYLRSQLYSPSDHWNIFWKYICQHKPGIYRGSWTNDLQLKLTIKSGKIEQLVAYQCDLASMFFVAESITRSKLKFHSLCRQAVRSVKHAGYFVAAFMENSAGYKVGDVEFPAVPVDAKFLMYTFKPLLHNLSITRIKIAHQPLRLGYTGMLLLTGSVSSA